jgi:hypothetical protein
MSGGGLYVLGGAKICPQAAGPLFYRLAVVVPAGRRLGPGGVRGDGEERVGEHGQGDVPVPGAVAAGLVVVQAGLALGFGEAVLDSPARARCRGEPGEGDQAR